MTLPRRQTSAMSVRLRSYRLVFFEFVRVLALEDVETFGIGLHQTVFDAVVDHLDEVARTDRAGMDVAALGAGIGDLLAARRARDVAGARRQDIEDGIDGVDGFLVAAHHHAVTALEAPDAAGCPDVDVVDAFRLQLFGASYVVLVEAVATVDDDVALAEELAQDVDRLARDLAGRQHHPDDARRFRELAYKIFQARSSARALVGELLDRTAIAIKCDAVMAMLLQPADDIAAHTPKSDYAELHRFSLSKEQIIVERPGSVASGPKGPA